MSANPYFAETPEELALLVFFRSLTPPQQKAWVKMLKTLAAFSKTMMEDAAHGHD